MVKIEVVFKSGIYLKDLGPLIEMVEKSGGVTNILPTSLNFDEKHIEATTYLISRVIELRRELTKMPEIDLRYPTRERQARELVETIKYLNPGIKLP